MKFRILLVGLSFLVMCLGFDTSQAAFQGVVTTTAIAWNPDGTKLAIGYSNGGVEIQNTATDKSTVTILRLGAIVRSMSWNPDGTKLAIASGDKIVRIWQINKPALQLLATFVGHKRDIYSVAWSPDGHELVSAALEGQNNLYVWDVVGYSSQPIARHTLTNLYSVVWSPDGKRFAMASTTGVWVCDQPLNRPISDSYFHRLGPFDIMGSVAWSPDGSKVVGAKQDGTVYVWDSKTYQEQARFPIHSDFVSALVWSSNARRLASHSIDGTVKVWNAATGQVIATLPTSKVWWIASIALNCDGTKLAYMDTNGKFQVVAVP